MPTAIPTVASVITTIAGTGASSYSGDSGAATSAAVYNPRGVALDSSGTFSLFEVFLSLDSIYTSRQRVHRGL